MKPKFKDKIVEQIRLGQLFWQSLFYNVHISPNYLFDTAIEPIFWCVDRFAHLVGPIFVATVLLLNVAVIAIAYGIGLPYYWHKNQVLAIFLVIFGQFFFVNVVFHYWKALVTPPGRPPMELPFHNVTSYCKKCVAPKPPRTHHCSVCNRCILKMDHHCPWLNNCVGHRNHRHFFLYMIYTVLGCVFLMTFGFEILWEDYFREQDPNEVFSVFSRHSLIWFEAFITTGCFLFLGGLTLWHGRLINRGETSIEAHINESERKRLKKKGKVYRNPYDFSPWHNWCLFLGMIDGRGWWHVLFPSSHPPRGNGLEWDTVFSCGVPWNESPNRIFETA